MKVEIVIYNPVDQESFKKLVLDGFKDFGFSYNSEYDSDLDSPETYSKNGGVLFLLKLDGDVIGSIAVINKGNGVAELKRWYVSRLYKGKGYGTMLLDKVLEFCKENKFKKIEFETNKKFIIAHEIYKKYGFSLVSENDRSYYMEKVF